jgi:hypothetical protein
MTKPKFKTKEEAVSCLIDRGYVPDEDGGAWTRSSWTAVIEFKRGWYWIVTL